MSISDGQNDFHTLTPHLLHGIDVSQVQDIDRVDAIELPTVTDSSGKPLFTGLYSGPYFDLRRTPRNITSQLGEAALIPCIVKQVGENSVSWIRRSDSHILSVDQTVFISDDRFRVLRPEPGNEWNLHIKPVSQEDDGLYECQISTKSKMSHYVALKVVVPSVKIEGRPDIHAQAGSSVILKCSITEALQKPRFVQWYRDGSPLFGDWKTTVSNTVKDTSTSSTSKEGRSYDAVIKLDRVDPEQSGLYECRPDQLEPATVNLHVVKGGTLAAMSDDRNEVSGSSHLCISLWVVLASFLTHC